MWPLWEVWATIKHIYNIVTFHHVRGKKMFMQFLIIWHLCGGSDVIKIEKTQERYHYSVGYEPFRLVKSWQDQNVLDYFKMI